MKFLIMDSSRIPCYLVPLRPEHLFQHLILKHPQVIFLPQTVSCPYKTRGNIVVLIVLMFNFWKRNNKIKMLDRVGTHIPREQPGS